LSPSFAQQRAKFLDAKLREAIELGVEIRDNRRERRLPAVDLAIDQAPATAFGPFAIW
jgi:hypothetical protein